MIITGILQACLGLFVLGLLVLIHELGHFSAAKLFKVRVLAFSIGFGRPLFSWRRGETEYRLSVIPVGGYVRMAGEQPEDNRTWQSDEFPAKPVWQRAIIAIAGPGFNYVFAAAFLWLAFVLGVEQPLYLDTARIGFVADSSSAAQAGIMAGDRILSMNGHLVSSWQDVEKSFTNLDKRYVIVVERDTTTLTFTVNGAVLKGNAMPKNPTAGLLPCLPPVIGAVSPGSSSEKAGLQRGDSVTAVCGTPIVSWLQLSDRIRKYDSTKGPMTIVFVRDSAARQVTLAPRYSAQEKRYLIGITMTDPVKRIVRWDAVDAVDKAFARSWEIVEQIFDILGKLFSRQVSPEQLAGPVGIIQMSGGIALLGFVHILEFMALIGVNLALFNLLPLVITDGGMLLFLLIEFLRGKPLSVKYQSIINQVAIACFVFLFLFVTFNDVKRIPEVFRMFGR